MPGAFFVAERISDGAAPGGKVSGNQLRNRVQYNEGAVKCGNSANNPQPAPPDQPLRPGRHRQKSGHIVFMWLHDGYMNKKL